MAIEPLDSLVEFLKAYDAWATNEGDGNAPALFNDLFDRMVRAREQMSMYGSIARIDDVLDSIRNQNTPALHERVSLAREALQAADQFMRAIPIDSGDIITSLAYQYVKRLIDDWLRS